jgi:hypothetical protein
MNQAFAGGTPMEAKIVNRQSNEVPEDASPSSEVTASTLPATSIEAPETLKEALDKIRDLYREEQAAKWGQGDQVNRVEDIHLALRKGRKEARECLKRELPDLKPSTLYAHAIVAKHVSQEHTKRWGVAKLQRLIALYNKGGGVGLLGDPADLEVRVPREDGSFVAKKFSDCSMQDLLSANKHRKQGRKAAGRVVHDVPSGADHASKLPSPVLWRPLAMIGLGVLAGFIADLLQPSVPGLVISVLALLLTLGGIAELIRYFVSIRDRIIAAFKSGATLKEQGLDVLRNGQKLLAAFRSVEPKPTPTSTREESPPPPEKKAA